MSHVPSFQSGISRALPSGVPISAPPPSRPSSRPGPDPAVGHLNIAIPPRPQRTLLTANDYAGIAVHGGQPSQQTDLPPPFPRATSSPLTVAADSGTPRSAAIAPMNIGGGALPSPRLSLVAGADASPSFAAGSPQTAGGMTPPVFLSQHPLPRAPAPAAAAAAAEQLPRPTERRPSIAVDAAAAPEVAQAAGSPPAGLSAYRELEVIGEGTFGKVSKVKRLSDGEIMVWKELRYGRMSEKEKQQLVAEVNILRELDHENIVKYYDRIIDRDAKKIYIVMEHCGGGDLAAIIASRRKDKRYVDEEFVWRVFAQVASALNEYVRTATVVIAHLKSDLASPHAHVA